MNFLQLLVFLKYILMIKIKSISLIDKNMLQTIFSETEIQSLLCQQQLIPEGLAKEKRQFNSQDQGILWGNKCQFSQFSSSPDRR